MYIFMLCYEECKQKFLSYVGPMLTVISYLANANVLLCNYSRDTMIILQKDWGSYQNVIHVLTYIIVVDSIYNH